MPSILCDLLCPHSVREASINQRLLRNACISPLFYPDTRENNYFPHQYNSQKIHAVFISSLL